MHPDHAFGMIEARRHLGDRKRRRVRDEQALVRDDGFERAEDLPLDRDLLEHRFDHEITTRVRRRVRRPGHERGEKAPLSFAEPAARDLLLEIGADRRNGLFDAGGVDVADHQRNLETPQEQRRELRGHQPGADDTDLLDAAWLRVWDPDALLHAPLDEVEGVDARLRLGAGE